MKKHTAIHQAALQSANLPRSKDPGTLAGTNLPVKRDLGEHRTASKSANLPRSQDPGTLAAANLPVKRDLGNANCYCMGDQR